nr:MAG TPA: hypothetical protein [Caudoviricetes sp.]
MRQLDCQIIGVIKSAFIPCGDKTISVELYIIAFLFSIFIIVRAIIKIAHSVDIMVAVISISVSEGHITKRLVTIDARYGASCLVSKC